MALERLISMTAHALVEEVPQTRIDSDSQFYKAPLVAVRLSFFNEVAMWGNIWLNPAICMSVHIAVQTVAKDSITQRMFLSCLL